MLAVASVLLHGTVVVDGRGARVYAGGYWPMLRVSPDQVRQAASVHINALEYGGWGYRISGRGAGFIMGSGPALTVRRRRRADYTYSLQSTADAESMAALLERYSRINNQ